MKKEFSAPPSHKATEGQCKEKLVDSTSSGQVLGERRKLGVTQGFTDFLEWADAKLNKTAVDLYVDGVSLANMG